MFRIIALLIGLVSVSNHRISAQPQGDQITVMAYNILDGFDGGKDQIRKKEMVDFIREHAPDVVGFQELVGFTADSLAAFAQTFGHPYSILLKEQGYPVGLTSTEPIKLKAKIHGNLWHGMLHASTHGIDFLVVHLSPHDAEIRLREANAITKYMEDNLIDQSRYIVLGDFNALSPFDAHFHEAQLHLLEATQRGDDSRGSHRNLIDGRFDYSVMSRFLQFPLFDVTQWFSPADARYSIPTAILSRGRIQPAEITTLRRRIDYILVSRELGKEVVSARVINQGVVDRLSDHYPVIATFSLSPP